MTTTIILALCEIYWTQKIFEGTLHKIYTKTVIATDMTNIFTVSWIHNNT